MVRLRAEFMVEVLRPAKCAGLRMTSFFVGCPRLWWVTSLAFLLLAVARWFVGTILATGGFSSTWTCWKWWRRSVRRFRVFQIGEGAAGPFRRPLGRIG
jgi:hypothetical protein